jgi:serine/arginine repetitive matrix protein 2
MESSSAAEQRAFAVAKLKRAASLPRMQNGRRPKMHVEAVSEGERSQGAASVEPDSETVTPEHRVSPGPDDMTIHPVNTFETAFVEPPTPTQSDHPEELPQSSTPAPGFTSVHELENENEAEAEPSAAKKRRRSRSRSRGSRDLRKLKGAQSPPLPTTRTTTPALPDDSSPEENQMILPSFLPFTPQVVAPVPSHYAQFQAQRLLMTPEPGMFFNTGMGAFSPPTSPSTPMPGMPTLEDIQRGAAARGLQRSNSAAARMMALNKLTMSQLPSRSNTPGLPGSLGVLALGRNNTVSGAEPRAAARQILLRRLGERIDKGDGVTSGSEERTATPKLPGSSGEDEIPRVSSPRRRRRRSRRGSGAVHAGVVDDRDLSSNAADTSTSVPPTPAIGANETLPEPFFAPLEPTSPMTPVQLERQNILNKLRGALRLDAASPLQTVSAQQTPKHRNRRSLVIEDDDDASMAPPIDALPSMTGLPPYNPVLAHIQGSERLPYSSNDSFPGSVGVPVFFEDKTMYGEDAFPSSPFATPFKEGVSMEAQASHLSPDFMRPPRSWQDNARDVSWIDDPREF